MSSVLQKDSELVFPSVHVITASAGSGKTLTLTQRLLQFLLSDQFSHSDLRRILAVTFTNHAAMEMKHRILDLLKRLCLGEKLQFDPGNLLIGSKSEIRKRACRVLDLILDHYSDLQIKTIDSFMASVFRASALEFGFSPDTEIRLDSDRILDRVFDQLARELENNVEREVFFREVVELVMFSRRDNEAYLWNPYRRIREKVQEIYTVVGRYPEPLRPAELLVDLKNLRDEITKASQKLLDLATMHEDYVSKDFLSDLKLLGRGSVNQVLERKPKAKYLLKDAYLDNKVTKWSTEFDRRAESLTEQIRQYAWLHARHFYEPFARLIGQLDTKIVAANRAESEVYLGDIHRRLARHLLADDVPDMYQRLGDQIGHFLIDEFQDTSPIQWANMRLLIENALASGGSLFVVGDTKQSIYAFNGADWRIMRSLEMENPFPSAARYERKVLQTNYRTDGVLVDFCKDVFQNRLARVLVDDASGLTTFEQEAEPDRRTLGYVTCELVPSDMETQPERAQVLKTIRELRERQHGWKDITILTADNYTVVRISSWLNEAGIPFISHSSLDVRRRKFTGEIVALLRFLNSPIDDLSFTTFVAGEVFGAYVGRYHPEFAAMDGRAFVLEHRRQGRRGLLYKHFQEAWPELWEECFEGLLSQVGYLPLYDLAAQIYGRFRVFDVCPEEGATAAKLLEIFKDFEQNENNSLKDFLDPAFEDRVEWEIQVPTGADAVHVMTTHKAKGLGFPVVILLLYGKRSPIHNPLVVREEGEISLWRITASVVKWDQRLESIRASEQSRHLVDDYNRLYVAMTRARQEMHIVAVGEAATFADLLPSMPCKWGRPTVPVRSSHDEPVVQLRHEPGRMLVEAGEWYGASLTSQQRGERIHGIVQNIVFVKTDIAGQVGEAAKAVEGATEEDVKLVINFLQLEEIRPFFQEKENRRILTEQEFVRSDGQFFRMDRIVVDADAVTVIDFKTSSEERPEYVEQVANYLDILRPFYPGKHLRGVIAYVNLRFCREVS